ncbi:D123-domain-containing protein [Bombardia bombarda]|uniref:D123-domain-containing protein n=1 Tax=Bombardia bombarda TaxID=252184 RepID=A0AA39XBA1_9PEZI|nr:D123-domain-containing protein [Bombardia bombarda]
MPAIEASASSQASLADGQERGLHFPPVTRDHILHCSYDFWFPKYRTSCIKSRVIPLTPEFISYIHEDGILLADDEPTGSKNDDDDDDEDDWEPTVPSVPRPRSASESEDSDSDSDDPRPAKLPPNKRFPALHNTINSAIAALGGAAAPKLNWSSPKDATWISRHPNTVKCTSANDVYMLLKSSSFISHDLDHAFDDTFPPPSSPPAPPNFTPVLVLRAFFNPLPSLEFRCFVKDRNLVAISQRDLNHYAFLRSLRPAVVARVRELFYKMRLSFPDACWVFDVYIPEADYAGDDSTDSDSSDDDSDVEGKETRRNLARLGRARLIDINPWAPRTDTLLFDWAELLDVRVAWPILGPASAREGNKTVRLPLRIGGGGGGVATSDDEGEDDDVDDDEDDEDDEYDDGEEYEPELRLVEQDDPAAYNFSSTQYSAHKLPKDVVDASLAGQGGIAEFARRWQRITEGQDRN